MAWDESIWARDDFVQRSDQLLGAVVGASSQDMEDEVIVTKTAAAAVGRKHEYIYDYHTRGLVANVPTFKAECRPLARSNSQPDVFAMQHLKIYQYNTYYVRIRIAKPKRTAAVPVHVD